MPSGTSGRCVPLGQIVFFLLAATALFPSERSFAAHWSVNPLNDSILDTSGAGFSVERLSGVTYLGASPVLGQHRFMAIQESNNSPVTSSLVLFDVTFSKAGDITATQAVSQMTVDESFFFEGIVSTDTSVFLARDDRGQGSDVREYDLSTGELIQSVTIPAVFTDNERFGLGFESLARNDSGTKMWTANESALTVDGPVATSTEGAVVRILEFDVNGNTVTAGNQFAYGVNAVHDSGLSSLSGLVELVSLPDGTLLALENSFAGLANPAFRSSINEIDFTDAGDVGSFGEGLNGETFTPVGKTELWGGQAGGSSGQNLEGLAVGPRLANGDWILLGVVDAAGPLTNTIVSFQLSPATPLPFDPDSGDFDEDDDVDGSDFLRWQTGFGVPSLAGLGHGDGNHDGDVDDDDLAIWEGKFGAGLPPPVTADFDEDDDIDGTDFLTWQAGFGQGTTLAQGDSNGSMSVDNVDLANWESMFGDVIFPMPLAAGAQTVPEPSALGLLLAGILAAIATRRHN